MMRASRGVRKEPDPGLRRRKLGLVALLLSGALLSGGCSDDVGECCTVLDDGDRDLIPTSTTSISGEPSSDIAIDPAFDCENLVCVAYRGSRAYCTARCFDDDDCPDDFSCRTVLESDPGPEAPIQPSDRFCVRDEHMCSE